MNSYGSSDIPLQRPEDAEEWKGAPFHGDFYREVDNVTRGVTLPPADPLVGGDHSYKDFDPLNGDFYREPDELCKGLNLGGGSYLDQQSLFGDKLGLASGIDYSHTLQDDSRAERFEEADIPLPVPADSFFKLEATTLYCATCMPFQIGNDLLDFLGEQVSTLTKVRRLKFSIKADVFVDGMMCTLKIRVYSQTAQQFAIEFQRRSGDGITFNATFQKAYQFLGSRPHLNLLPLEAPLLLNSQPLQLPLGFEEPINDEEVIQPLLDLMGKVDAPWLQVEAALSLSKLAAEGKPALRTDHVFQGITQGFNGLMRATKQAGLLNVLTSTAEGPYIWSAASRDATGIDWSLVDYFVPQMYGSAGTLPAEWEAYARYWVEGAGKPTIHNVTFAAVPMDKILWGMPAGTCEQATRKFGGGGCVEWAYSPAVHPPASYFQV